VCPVLARPTRDPAAQKDAGFYPAINSGSPHTMSAKRDQYVAKTKHQLDELNAQIDSVEAHAKKVKQEASKTYDKELTELRQQSAAAKTRLEDIKNSSEDKWESLTEEMEKVRDALVHSYNYFKSQLKD
jgi:predicted  nucleic acid-binding Zn-ribbon protein